jgi:hypothetical protein
MRVGKGAVDTVVKPLDRSSGKVRRHWPTGRVVEARRCNRQAYCERTAQASDVTLSRTICKQISDNYPVHLNPRGFTPPRISWYLPSNAKPGLEKFPGGLGFYYVYLHAKLPSRRQYF